MNTSSGKYYIKNSSSGNWQDLTSLFDGLAILKIDGLIGRGKPVNIYTAQWVMEQEEDYVITLTDANNNPIVIRENVDIEITFIIKDKYSSSQTQINVLSVHDSFINYVTSTDVWIKSSYMGNKSAHCVCLNDYKPTTVKLDRGINSYIIGTVTLHCLSSVV